MIKLFVTLPFDGLALLGSRASAGTRIANFRSYVYKFILYKSGICVEVFWYTYHIVYI